MIDVQIIGRIVNYGFGKNFLIYPLLIPLLSTVQLVVFDVVMSFAILTFQTIVEENVLETFSTDLQMIESDTKINSKPY